VYQIPGHKPRFDIKLEDGETTFFKVKQIYLVGQEKEKPKASVKKETGWGATGGSGGGSWGGTSYGLGDKSKGAAGKIGDSSSSKVTKQVRDTDPTEREESDAEDDAAEAEDSDKKTKFKQDDIVDVKVKDDDKARTRFRRGYISNVYPDGTFKVSFESEDDCVDHVTSESMKKPTNRHIKHSPCDSVQSVLMDESDGTLSFVKRLLDSIKKSDKSGFKTWEKKVLAKKGGEAGFEDDFGALDEDFGAFGGFGGFGGAKSNARPEIERLSLFFAKKSWERAPEFTLFRDLIVLTKLALEPDFTENNSKCCRSYSLFFAAPVSFVVPFCIVLQPSFNPPS
jgi:hypothetical protein